MGRKREHLFQDLALLIFSIGVAIFAVKTGLIHQIISFFDGLYWLNIVLAGAFFTSVFTTAPSIVLLGMLAKTTSLPIFAVLGGLGAALGDHIIFRFMRDRIFKDFEYLISFRREQRFFAIFKTRLFRFFIPFLGALIIASPFPDEIGITMLGMSKMKNRTFFLLSFIMNGIGIFVIGWIARIIV